MISAVKDPVCGMTIDPATAATRLAHGAEIIHFCSITCGRHFARDPDRYLGGSDGPYPDMMDMARHGDREAGAARSCPECGTDVEAAGETVLGELTIPEFATMVRHRWRRRLGKRAYRRTHSDRLIRALALHALKPESPVARISAEEELRREMARLRAEGLNRAHIQRELYHLSRAAADVLLEAGLDRVRTASLIETMDRELVSLIEWRHNLTRDEAWEVRP